MKHDQHIASDPQFSVWVSASAGTGKTKVLTNRVLRLLLDGSLPERILCITYTNAAAAEMESRIEAQLGKWAIADDVSLRDELLALTGVQPDSPRLQRARQLFTLVLDSPSRVRIQTIHGFCQSVLRRFPLEAGVVPYFTLIDDYTTKELLHEARLRLFNRSRREEDPACAQAIEAIGALIAEETLSGLLKDIISERRKFLPWFEEAKAATLEMEIDRRLEVEPGTTLVMLLQRHFNYNEEEKHSLRQVAAVLNNVAAETDKRCAEALQSWLQREDWESYQRAFITLKGEPRKKLCTQAVEKKGPFIKEVLAKEQARMVAFTAQLKSLRIAQASQHIVVLAQALLDIYRQQKRNKAYLDYDDLILKTVQLLTQKNVAPWVLYKLDGGIDHLLLDEAQDTAPAQWRLVYKLTEEFFAGNGARDGRRSVFIVGDEKQSIYSFQGAEPEAFNAMQQRFSRRAEAASIPFKRVYLTLSFRSTEPVLKMVDMVFASPAAREGLIFSEQDIRHALFRKDQGGRAEFWPLITPATDEGFEPWHIAQRYHYAERAEVLCANRIAETIAQWLKEKRVLFSRQRSVQAGDILILVQRRGFFASAMLRALKQHDIPVSGADRLILTEHIAVEDCLALIRFLLLPQDDLSLAALLKSPLIGLTEEALFELAYDRGSETLWQRLKQNPRYAATYELLSDLLAKTDYISPFELFTYVLENGGGRRKLAARLGFEVGEPLDEFLSLTLQYERLHIPSLQGFLHWLESGATEIKRDLEKGRDEVRLMTVHGAKGLQAPIVFLPDTTRTPRYDSGLLWTKGSRPVPLWSPYSDYDDLHYRNLKQSRREEIDREYRRLLYVAMTRAEDELYICGWKGSKPVAEYSWYELIRQALPVVEGEKYVFSSEQKETVVPTYEPAAIIPVSTLPGWVAQPPPPEATPPRPLTPSHMGTPGDTASFAGETAARERGLLVHRLLQTMPEVAIIAREAALEKLMQRYAEGLAPQEKTLLVNEVIRILDHPDFAPVFSAHSIAEAPITGMVTDSAGNPVVISGQIDRLSVVGEDVYIVDYKTNRKVPADIAQVPKAYMRQIAAYHRLIKDIYPDKTLHCAFLWTTAPQLMAVDNALLESLAA